MTTTTSSSVLDAVAQEGSRAASRETAPEPGAARATTREPGPSHPLATSVPPPIVAPSSGLRRAGGSLRPSDQARGDVTVMGTRAQSMGDGHEAIAARPAGHAQPAIARKPIDSAAAGRSDIAASLAEVGEFILVVDADYRVVDCTQEYLRLLGMEAHQVVGRRVHEYIPNFASSSFFAAFQRAIVSQQSSIQVAYSRALSVHISMRLHPRKGGGFIVTGSPASPAMLGGHDELSRGLKDETTQLDNRHALNRHLAEHVSRLGYVAVGLVEWLNPQIVRDRLSSEDAEMVLLDLVARLRGELRAGEALYLVDTSLFGVIFTTPLTAEAQHARMGEMLRAIGTGERPRGSPVPLSACAALAVHDVVRSQSDANRGVFSATTASEVLFHQARLAMREARAGGSGSVVGYSKAHQQRLELEADLLRAINTKQFVLYAQPKLDLFRNRICGAELLVRWNHPTQGVLPPGAFLESLADLNLMRELDSFVIDTALDQLSELEQRGITMPLSINLSVQTLCDPGFVGRLKARLDERGIRASLLEIEIPEGELMRNVESSASVLEDLRALGVKLSIDDFGTGYCSFRYLGLFPVDTLKIDRSFVQHMHENGRDRALVEAMIRLGQAIGLKVVAEGAETAEHVEMLVAAGCNQLQGYVFARPMPFADFTAFACRPAKCAGLSPIDVSL